MPIGYTPNYFSQYEVKDERKPAASAARVSGGLPNFAALAAAGRSAAAQAGRGALAGSQAAGFSQLGAQAAAQRAASGGVAPAASRAAAGSALDRWRRAQAPSIANLERYAESIAPFRSPANNQAARASAGYTPPRASSISEYVAGIQPAIRGTSAQRYASNMVSPYAGTQADLDSRARTASRGYTSQPAFFAWAGRTPAEQSAASGISASDSRAAAVAAQDRYRTNFAAPLAEQAGGQPGASGAFSGELPPNLGGLPPGFGEDPTADLASLQELFPNLGYDELVDAYLQYITTRGQAGRGAIDSAFEDRGVYESSDRDFAVNFFDQLLELEKNQGVAAIQRTGTAPSTFTAPSGGAGTSGFVIPPDLPASEYSTRSYANR